MEDYPEKEYENLQSAVKLAAAFIPGIGGALGILFDEVISRPLDKRRQNWCRELISTINDLSNEVDSLKPENLAKNEEFLSVCVQASYIAMRTHQDDKLKSLLNAVKNTAKEALGNEAKRMLFLRIIDEMTELHIRVFVFLKEIGSHVERLNTEAGPCETPNWQTAQNVWKHSFDDIKENDPMLDIVMGDLHRYGFVYKAKFFEARLECNCTPFGKDFYDFIYSKS